MKKGLYLGLLFLASMSLAKLNDLGFVCCVDWKEFLSQHVPQEKHNTFLHYYREVDQKIKQADQAQQRKAVAQLHKTALHVLEKEHPEWHQAITTFFGDPLVTIHTNEQWEMARKATDLFLTRYGAYHVFSGTKLESDEKKQEGFWQSLVNSVTGWFGSSERTTT